MTYKRKKYHHGDTHERKRWRTRNRKKDLDEINEDIKPGNIDKLLNQEIDEDKPGLGQFYCVHCARYFIDNDALKEHFRAKGHKRRLKDLESEPYTIEESERASGKGSYLEPKKRKIETQPLNEMQVDSEVQACDHPAIAKTFVQPHIDLEQKFEEISKLKENVEKRKLQIDPIKLKSLWDFLQYLKLTKVQLEKRKTEIADHIKDLKKIGNDDGEVKQEVEKLKLEGRIVREDLKTLMKAFWEVEEKVLIKGLLLPNELHKDTPENEDKIIHQYKEQLDFSQRESHIEIGHSLGIIDFRDPSLYFLKNTGALFELSCISYFMEGLKVDDFIPFCNPDFSRSIILDGCTIDHKDPASSFTVYEPNEKAVPNYKLHLVGGASLFSFCAFHAKQLINFSSLPLKYFTAGRQYSPVLDNEDELIGLFNTTQRTCVELFILTADDYSEMMSVFQKTLNVIISLYEQLGYHFRVSYLSASLLQPWECLRASFQMYSSHEQRYVEVGKISISDNYICERLSMSYQMSEKDDKNRFMKMVSGTVVDVPKLLGCILEQGGPDGKFSIPECLREFSFI